MDYGYTQQLASPLRGRGLEELKDFLARMDLTYAPGIEHTALIRDGEGEIAATASLEGNVIKCVAVDPAGQGQGLTAPLLTALRQKAMEEGRRRLFLYTKPANRTQFAGMGFYEVARTVGYSDGKYFAKLFTRETGLTPKEYREKHREI